MRLLDFLIRTGEWKFAAAVLLLAVLVGAIAGGGLAGAFAEPTVNAKNEIEIDREWLRAQDRRESLKLEREREDNKWPR